MAKLLYQLPAFCMCNNSYSVYPACDALDTVCDPDPFAPQSHRYDLLVGLYKLWGAPQLSTDATATATATAAAAAASAAAALASSSSSTSAASPSSLYHADASVLLAGAAGGRFFLSTLPDWLLWAALILHIYTMRRGGVWGAGFARYPSSFRPVRLVWHPKAGMGAVARVVSYGVHWVSTLLTAVITEVHVLLRPGTPMNSIHWNFAPGERHKSGIDLYTATFFVQLLTFIILALTFEQGGSTFVQVCIGWGVLRCCSLTFKFWCGCVG